MKQKEQVVNEIKAIREMMEQSSRFLSLSGLSGILIGIFALLGAYLVNYSIQTIDSVNELVLRISLIAVVVLIVSIIAVIILTYRKTISDGQKIWNKGTRLLLLNLMVPLIAGGLLTGIFVTSGLYQTVVPVLLVFYGLALVNAAKYTRQEIYYMGLCQITIGILAALLPQYALILWALGFGVIHILYGAIMHFKYDNHPKTETP